ncbi:unnamed protein product [Toxocara canis]|uniref:Uncharacterized protein n=1 Tax=Toxocara canis TaxID=6265 RepID=A0A183UVM3_TOXCA|nr:unnamed protein product [Toxocara canis]
MLSSAQLLVSFHWQICTEYEEGGTSAHLDSAILFAWRLLLFDEEEEGDAPLAESSMESLAALLPTDTMPASVHNNVASSTSSCDDAASSLALAKAPAPAVFGAKVPALAAPPVPELIFCSDRYAQFSEQHLHSIPEEESDDLCSQSSCSSRRAPTVIPAHSSSPYKELSFSQEIRPPSITPPPPVPPTDTQPVPFDQLTHVLRSIDSDTDSSLESTEKCCCKTSNANHLPFIKFPQNDMATADRDRDQCEVIVERLLDTISPTLVYHFILCIFYC